MNDAEHREQAKLFAWAEWERLDRPELGLDRALRNEGRPSVYEGRGLIVI